MAEPRDTTEMINAFCAGDSLVQDELFRRIYDELKRLARNSAKDSLETGDLINEAYLRLLDQRKADWHSRTHFLRFAAKAMRRIVIDHIRKKAAKKRDPGVPRSPDVDLATVTDMSPDQAVAFDELLNHLEEFDERVARVVELKAFALLTVEEIADVLGVSQRTVKYDLAWARSFLTKEMQP